MKKGVYRLHRSVLWTEADNRVLINALLGVYTALIDACKGDVKEIFSSQDLSNTEKLQSVKTFNACVSMIDRLMKRCRWCISAGGTNPRLAKADAAAKTSDTEKVDLAGGPPRSVVQGSDSLPSEHERDMFQYACASEASRRRSGCMVLRCDDTRTFGPADREPISEAEARRRLMKRKSSKPAPLFLFA